MNIRLLVLAILGLLGAFLFSRRASASYVTWADRASQLDFTSIANPFNSEFVPDYTGEPPQISAQEYREILSANGYDPYQFPGAVDVRSAAEPPDNFDMMGDYSNMGKQTVSISPDANVAAFLALIREVEANGQYNVIAGGDLFNDFSEHPFILNPNRRKPLGTTAAGAYQMVVGTWKMARDALGLKDFSRASQDRAAIWILDKKRPGSLALIKAGRFDDAIARLSGEWEAFAKMLQGAYSWTLAEARDFLESSGGTYA